MGGITQIAVELVKAIENFMGTKIPKIDENMTKENEKPATCASESLDTYRQNQGSRTLQTKDKVPVFVDPRNSKYYGYGTPLSVKTQYKKDKSKLHLMTLKDKKYLAATSWQLLCRQTAVICETVAKYAPLENEIMLGKDQDITQDIEPSATSSCSKNFEKRLYQELSKFTNFETPKSTLKDLDLD